MLSFNEETVTSLVDFIAQNAARYDTTITREIVESFAGICAKQRALVGNNFLALIKTIRAATK